MKDGVYQIKLKINKVMEYNKVIFLKIKWILILVKIKLS